MTELPLSFLAQVESGRGRGKEMGIPTLNLALMDVHPDLEEGIYACFVTVEGEKMQAAMHYGPRPVFKDTLSCEAHLLDRELSETPTMVKVDVIGRLRDVADFPSKEELIAQIQRDVETARKILSES